MPLRLPGHRAHRHAHDSFEGEARHYDWVARHLMGPVYRRIAADVAAVAPHGASVLDVGTGPGRLLVEIARRRPDLRLTGLDPATDMVETARRNLAEVAADATAVTGGVEDLPFDDGSFDLVVSSLSLHHWADPAAGAAELARVLAPGGEVRVYDLGLAPFDALQQASLADGARVSVARFRVSPLPWPRLVRLVISRQGEGPGR